MVQEAGGASQLRIKSALNSANKDALAVYRIDGSSRPQHGILRRATFAAVRWGGLAWLIRHTLQRRAVTILTLHDTTPDALDVQLEELGKRYNFVTLRDYVRARNSGMASLPLRPLALTIDDGHRACFGLTEVFRKHGVVPTIFLCSGLVGTNRRFWWMAPCDRERIDELKRLPDVRRVAELKRLGFEETESFADRASLSPAEIDAMRDSFDFQSHSVLHPILPRCSDGRAHREVVESRLALQDQLGLDIYAFSYPNGDYSSRDVALVSEAGYECAVTIDPGFNTGRTDPLRLRRIGMDEAASVSEVVARASGLPAIAQGVLRRRH